MNNENPKQQLIDEYIKKVNNTPDIELNQDQKELIKEILTKIDPKYIQNAYQMLNQRVKIGFTFDEAPSTSKTNIALLVKDEKRSFTNNVMNASDFENSLIIGENYDALKNLIQIEKIRAMTGGGHSDFDIIYIDPPYNTESAKTDGNVSANNNENISASKFIYRDKFSRNGWLNMMKERLIMARQLLKEDGVIFVSIDDNEQAYLKVLMDEIFGEENFVGKLLWQSNNSSMKYSKFFRDDFEYVLVYAKTKKNLKEFTKKQNKDITFLNPDSDPKGKWFSSNATYTYNEKSKNTFAITLPSGSKITRTWRFTKSQFDNNEINLYFNGNNVPRIKIYEYEYSILKTISNLVLSIDNLRLNDSFFNYVDSFTKSKKILDSIVKNNFETPKPINLIKLIIKLFFDKNARVLDFFAGSGTTGHAVLELNREDGGSRTYTLVTNDENNIGTDVTYERLYRINNGKGTKGETNFKWLEKNDSYKQNLNVYNIEYYDASIDKREKDESDDVSLKLLKKLDELLNSLNLKSTEINNEQKLNILTELNALEKKVTINESK